MNKLEGSFSPDEHLSPERAEEANTRLETEKENLQQQREQFLKDFDLEEIVNEYSQSIPEFGKIKDQIIDELQEFVESKTGVDLNDPKEGKILKEELEKKIVARAEESKKTE